MKSNWQRNHGFTLAMPFIKVLGSIFGLTHFILLLRNAKLEEMAFLGLIMSIMIFFTAVLDFGGRSLMPIQFKIQNITSVRANLVLNWFSGLLLMFIGLSTALILQTSRKILVVLVFVVIWLSLEKLVEAIIGLTVVTRDSGILFVSILLRKVLPLGAFIFLLTTNFDPFLAYSICLSIGSALSLIHATLWMKKHDLLETPHYKTAWEEFLKKRYWTIQNVFSQINSLDIYLLRFFTNISVVGEYTSIQRLFSPMTNFLESFLANLRVGLTTWSPKKVRKLVFISGWVALITTVFFLICAKFAAEILSLILTEVFPNMEDFFVILLLLLPFQLLSQLYSSCLISLQQEDFLTRLIVISAPLSIFLGCLGGYLFSAIGVIAGTMLIHLTSALIKYLKILHTLSESGDFSA